MKNTGICVGEIISLYHQELSHFYRKDETDRFLRLLFETWKNWNRASLAMNKTTMLDTEIAGRFRDALEALKRREPIQYIIGVSWFMDFPVNVNNHVLIPRPETEELVQWILEDQKAKNGRAPEILDIGTGSGCIAIALKRSNQEASVTGIDISEEALKIASENAKINNCPVRFLKADILNMDGFEEVRECDVIVSNPPYITPEDQPFMEKNVMDHEPHLALFVPSEDPLKFYKAILQLAKICLKKEGRIYFEINEKYGREIKELLISYGFSDAEIRKDFFGKDRFAKASRKS
jgi:release factor glutamine methyltransferase